MQILQPAKKHRGTHNPNDASENQVLLTVKKSFVTNVNVSMNFNRSMSWLQEEKSKHRQ